MTEQTNRTAQRLPGASGKALWARRPSAAAERVTQRQRNMVEGLPDWEPLPPGEILVRRHLKD